MKKLALALVCLISVAFFASCTPKGNPTITVLQEEGYVKDGDVVTSGQEFNFGFVVASSIETSKELSTLVIYIDDEEAVKENLTGTEYTYKGALTLTLTRELPTSVIKAVVTDVAGAFATASITVSIEESTNVEVKDIAWVRRGTTVQNAEEMAEYGLQWTGSYKETMATIKPLDGFSMYLCDGDDFAKIKTQADKAAYFSKIAETQKPIEAYREISAEAGSQTPNDMLALINEKGDQYLVLFSTAKAEYLGSQVGTEITINGKAAK